jgi:hypothetical protein
LPPAGSALKEKAPVESVVVVADCAPESVTVAPAMPFVASSERRPMIWWRLSAEGKLTVRVPAGVVTVCCGVVKV